MNSQHEHMVSLLPTANPFRPTTRQASSPVWIEALPQSFQFSSRGWPLSELGMGLQVRLYNLASIGRKHLRKICLSLQPLLTPCSEHVPADALLEIGHAVGAAVAHCLKKSFATIHGSILSPVPLRQAQGSLELTEDAEKKCRAKFGDRLSVPAERAIPMLPHRDKWGALDGQNKLAYCWPSSTPHSTSKQSLLYIYLHLHDLIVIELSEIE